MGTAETIVEAEAFEVETVDTCGAGDVFCGAVIHGMLEQWSPAGVLEFAMAAAALKCQRMGNREALPSLDQVGQFLRLATSPSSRIRRKLTPKRY